MGDTAAPRNVDYYLSRLSGYSKNTIKLQPQTKFEYNANDTVTFRLPTNSILDLHTLTMKFACQLYNTHTTLANDIGLPRFTQSFIKRLHVYMGGSDVGLQSLQDYGFLYYLLAVHKVPSYRSSYDLAITDLGDEPDKAANGGSYPGVYPRFWTLAPKGTDPTAAPKSLSGWLPMTISSWLGILGGSFMRFLVSWLLFVAGFATRFEY